MRFYIGLAAALIFAGCKGPAPAEPQQNAAQKETVMAATSAAIPLRKHLACLPKDAAMVAAHRGTSKKADLPENSASSLKAVMAKGILMAEVDVAGLKDGTHILFHDGVWEEKTSGKGVVAATSWVEAENYLLKETDGDFSGDRLIKLEEALALSKNRLYLEIDFKSSAKYKTVIDMIRAAGMAEHVILIAYNEGQARKLAKLAPEMLLSVSAASEADIALLEKAGVKKQNMAIWMGKGPYDHNFVTYLDDADIPVLAWPREKDRKLSLGPATVAVTDYALQKDPIEGLSRAGEADYKACLAE